jgi:hypothetical protein
MTAPNRGEAFRYEGYDVHGNTLTCRYSLDDRAFVETVAFPAGGAWERPEVAAAARLVYLLAGVSYYKTAAPPRISLPNDVLSVSEAALLRDVYVEGLAEFGYVNDLDLRDVHIDAAIVDDGPRPVVPANDTVLVPFGGGIDSIVTVELMRPLADLALFVVGRPNDRYDAIERAAAITKLPIVRAERALDEQVLRSRELGFLNGHVPITGVISAIAVLAAALAGRSAVVMSNEWSASAATLDHGDRPINHQWSKSLAFEAEFRHVAPVEYFSRLRPYSEYWIAERFARLDQYHDTFRSCNRAFHTDPARRLDHWCGECDKCCFIDLILAPFVPRVALEAVFDGKEPLANPALRPQFEALLDISGAPRPFECIGDVTECRAAGVLAARRPDRQETTLLRELVAGVPEPDLGRLMRPLGPHFIPERYATDDLLA